MSENRPTPHERADAQVPKIRYIFVLPIVSSFIAALVLLIAGFVETLRVIAEVFQHNDEHMITTLRVGFIEAVDVFLLATILYVIGVGFYQLFLGGDPTVADWMKVESVHELEVMLIGVTITLLGVTGLEAVMSWDGSSNLWQLGISIALIIGALAIYLRGVKH